MQEKRVKVWVQAFKDRKNLMLQWIDPDTGKRETRSAGTDDPKKAEQARADKEYELNHGKHQEASRMTWERFRERFEDEYVAALRPDTCRNYRVALDLFEKVCRPGRLRSVTERTVSAFAAGLRQLPGYGGEPMKASSVKVRLQFLHTALVWAAGQKLLPECPKFPVVRVPKKKPRPVPAESFERVLDKADDPQMNAYLLCGWLAGLRLREALHVEWEQTDEAPWLDFARDRIWLPAGFVKAVEDQWVPLDPRLREALEALPRRGRKVFHFVDARDGHRVGPVAISHRVTELARRAGVRLTMKTLRAGFGCRHAARVPAQVLQRLMRHANISTTMDYYANVDQAVEEAILGPRCNSSRNTPAKKEGKGQTVDDGSPCQNEGNG